MAVRESFLKESPAPAAAEGGGAPRQLSRLAEELVASCRRTGCAHLSPAPIPDQEAVISLVRRLRRLMFPGYFHSQPITEGKARQILGQELAALWEDLSCQIALSWPHDCRRTGTVCRRCRTRGRQEALRFLKHLPRIRELLATDVQAAYEGDPAATGPEEIIYCYPGLFAVMVYRVAHQLWEQGVRLLPRIMTEYAHSRTGIDIHPGARIGASFFIDHGTGVVIGETTDIGRRVRLYQGVTLGALSVPPERVEELRHRKRHPTVEDEVIIYAGATILGGHTVIGARSVIGGNVWLTESVPPDTKVFLKRPELVIKGGPAGAAAAGPAGGRAGHGR